MSEIKCRKCRRVVFDDKILVTNHGISYHNQNSDQQLVITGQDITADGIDNTAVSDSDNVLSGDKDSGNCGPDMATAEDISNPLNTNPEVSESTREPDITTTSSTTSAVTAETVKTLAADLCTKESDVYYVAEDLMTDWMRDQLDASDWTKGRLVCPIDGCDQRIGVFDFTNSRKCRCYRYRLPNIQISRSRVDWPLAATAALATDLQ